MTRKQTLVPRANRVDINREFRTVDEFINEYVTNISHSGAFIRSKDPLPVGTKVNLKFSVILDEIETIEGIGEVVRVSDRPRGMGVVFISLNEHSQHLLAKLLTRPPAASKRTTPPPPPVPLSSPRSRRR
ncbi:MAG TPA: PilZ domain-containing protein [Polyangia bacterium]